MLSPMFDKKNNLRNNFEFSPQSPYKIIASCNFLSHLITAYHTLSPMFDKKIMSVTTLHLASSLLKKLSHLAASYQVFRHLITPYPPCLIIKKFPLTVLNLASRLLKTLSPFSTSYHILSDLITCYPNLSERKLITQTTLNLVSALLAKLSHLSTSYHIVSHLTTPYLSCLIEN